MRGDAARPSARQPSRSRAASKNPAATSTPACAGGVTRSFDQITSASGRSDARVSFWRAVPAPAARQSDAGSAVLRYRTRVPPRSARAAAAPLNPASRVESDHGRTRWRCHTHPTSHARRCNHATTPEARRSSCYGSRPEGAVTINRCQPSSTVEQGTQSARQDQSQAATCTARTSPRPCSTRRRWRRCSPTCRSGPGSPRAAATAEHAGAAVTALRISGARWRSGDRRLTQGTTRHERCP